MSAGQVLGKKGAVDYAANQSRFRSDRRGGCLWACGLAPPSPARPVASSFCHRPQTKHCRTTIAAPARVSDHTSLPASKSRQDGRVQEFPERRRVGSPPAPNSTPDGPVEDHSKTTANTDTAARWVGRLPPLRRAPFSTPRSSWVRPRTRFATPGGVPDSDTGWLVANASEKNRLSFRPTTSTSRSASMR